VPGHQPLDRFVGVEKAGAVEKKRQASDDSQGGDDEKWE